jgi:hypothetical protein
MNPQMRGFSKAALFSTHAQETGSLWLHLQMMGPVCHYAQEM